MIELTFYWSLSISQFFDVKRKDFVEMFIHHVTTIALLSFSWTCNLTRYLANTNKGDWIILKSLLIQIWMLSFVTQMWISRALDPRLRWHLPGACQDASLRQARHTLWHRVRTVFVYLDRDKTRCLPNMDILQVYLIYLILTGWIMQVSFSSTVEAPQIVEMFPAYYIFNGLFSILLVLHVIWTYFIYKVAYRSLTKSVSDFNREWSFV